MGFTSGGKVLADIIDEIADALIASSANWVEGDSTWDTTDRTGNNARRCLKYTGDADDIWMTLEACNTSNQVWHDGTYWNYAKGLRTTFCASWDVVNHTHPSGTLSLSSTMVTYELRRNGAINADIATQILTYFLWVDPSGFALMAKPEPNSTDDRQASFIHVVEHFAAKEYSDGMTNFFCFTELNYDWYGTGGTTGYQLYHTVRPFAFRSQNSALYGILFWKEDTNSRYALKSTGNGKVYFVKPIYCNSTDGFTPIAQSELFWQFPEQSGLVDGDVIAIDGATTKYICKTLDSPDSTGRINYAIKYVA